MSAYIIVNRWASVDFALPARSYIASLECLVIHMSYLITRLEHPSKVLQQ